MSISKAQQKATAKYMKNNYDEMKIRIYKGNKDKIKAHAESTGETLNKFVIRAISETMAREGVILDVDTKPQHDKQESTVNNINVSDSGTAASISNATSEPKQDGVISNDGISDQQDSSKLRNPKK